MDLEEEKPILEKDSTEEPTSEEPTAPIVKDKKLFVITPDEATDIKATKRQKKRKKPRSGCLTSFVWIAIIGVISIAISFAVIVTAFDFLGIGDNPNTTELAITETTKISDVPDMLQKAGAINYPIIFRLYLKLTKADTGFKPGIHQLEPHMGYAGIVNELKKIRKLSPETSVTIPEGSTVDEIIAILIKKKVISSKDDFTSAMWSDKFSYKVIKDIPTEKVHYRFEGYLFPDTYSFYTGRTGKYVIDRMLIEMNNKINDDMYAKAKKMGYTIHEIITLASIIEEEASGNTADMKNVAAVFYNRLNWKDQPKLLGSTPTALYPHGGDKYDTNKYEGLPPGPVCSPSLNAIMAALNPTPNFKATYFVTDKKMKFYYSNSLTEHNRIIRNLKNAGNWQY